MLEGVKFEESEKLQEMWVSLLSHAASGKMDTALLPCFPEILRQLSPLEARILERLFEVFTHCAREVERAIDKTEELKAAIYKLGFEISEIEMFVCLDNLIRLGLCEGARWTDPSKGGALHFESGWASSSSGRKQGYRLTQLGIAFVEASRPLGN